MPEVLLRQPDGAALLVRRHRSGWSAREASGGRASRGLDPFGLPDAFWQVSRRRSTWPRPLPATAPPREGVASWLVRSWVDGSPALPASRPWGMVRVDRWLVLAPAGGEPVRDLPSAWTHALAATEPSPTLFVDARTDSTVVSCGARGRPWPSLATCRPPAPVGDRSRSESVAGRASLLEWTEAVAAAAARFLSLGPALLELCGSVPAGAESLGDRLGLPVRLAEAGPEWRGPRGWWSGPEGASWRRAGRLLLGGAHG